MPGLAAEVITYRCRSAIRDVGKALGLSLDRVDALAKQVEGYTHEPQLAQRCRQVGIDPLSDRGQRLIYLVNELIGFPRHLSQHVGGMVITRGPLVRTGPDRKRGDGRSHRHQLGQERSGRPGHPESRLPGPGYADRHPQGLPAD